MLFNSYIFIFLFLPLALIGWFGLNKIEKYKLAQWFLVAMSLWFYGYFNPGYLVVILGSSLFNFLFSAMVKQYEKKQAACFVLDKTGNHVATAKTPEASIAKRVLLIFGVAVNLGILGYFKYYDFFIENVNAALGTDFALHHILLPLGISFFTFQQVSFAIDRCRGTAPHYGVADYLCFVTFFPQLIAGPIVLHSELIPQFQDKEKRRFNINSFSQGIVYFTIGLAKKVLLADTLAKVVNFGFESVAGIDTITAIVIAVTFSFELYFDFSGYCDMAIGIGKMFGIEIPDNFDSPYKSASAKEFWRRWHMTLGRFFTTYVYFPLGGSRKGKVRTIINTMIVFTLSGLWHGANWTFVLWGFLHGVAVSINSLTEKKGQVKTGLKKLVCQVATFIFVMLAFVIFRSDNLATVAVYFERLFSFSHFGSLYVLAEKISMSEIYIVTKLLDMKAPELLPKVNLGMLILVMVISVIVLAQKRTKQIVENCKWTTGFAIKMTLLFVWSVISLSGVSTFLYFNF